MMTQVLFLLLLLVLPLFSNATISLNQIRGASHHEIPESGTPSIFGGVAGDSTAGTCANATNSETCDNCYDNGLTASDARLLVCNNSRIHSQLRLVIRMTSDSLDNGLPLATLRTTSGTETVVSKASETPTSQSKGSAFEIVVVWSDLCSAMGRSANCDTGGATDGTAFTLRAGISKDKQSSTSLSGSGDEFKEISVKVIQEIGQGGTAAGTSTAPSVLNCSSNTGLLCDFDLTAGDEKAVVKTLRASPGFPVAGNSTFRAVRMLRVQGTGGIPATAPAAQANFARINPASSKTDLVIRADGSGFVTDPKRVTGLSNSTDQAPIEYYFKAALVDQAGNVGYYTSDAEDLKCYANEETTTQDTRVLGECHRVEPGEVLGVLAEQVNCFIATAAYGSPMAPQVETFRNFRDQFLLPTKLGKNFVRFYYKEAPAYAEKIAQNETLRTLARGALWPVLGYASLTLKLGPILATFLSLIVLLTVWITLRMSFSVAAQAVRARYNKMKRNCSNN